MAKAKALVTGGAGFIGSHLTTALLERDCVIRLDDEGSEGRVFLTAVPA